MYTIAAETLIAQYTLQAGQTAVAMLTEIAAQATRTPTPPTTLPPMQDSPTPTITPTLSPASPTPAATQTTTRCNQALLIGDVTITPGTIFAPGARFTKIWRLQNAGSCTWTRDYALVFVDGDSMRGEGVVPLSAPVPPGGTVDLAVDLTAPSVTGLYQGSWMLRDDRGNLFGVGASAAFPFMVQIRVAASPVSPGYAYDFTLDYCLAEWSSESGSLPCPGDSGDLNGSVLLLDNPPLESRQENELALWTRPNQSTSGFISGRYPPYRVLENDRFVAEIGCLSSSPGCSLTFLLDYEDSRGRVFRLGSWQEIYDGQSTRINLDLNSLAGQTVRFILSVYNDGRSSSADGFWFQPHIRNRAPVTGLVTIWQQQSIDGETCRELRLYLLDDSSAEALALSCTGREQGVTSLTQPEADLLVAWADTLQSFEAEIYDSTAIKPLDTWISFFGAGKADPVDADIREIHELATRLYNRIIVNR